MGIVVTRSGYNSIRGHFVEIKTPKGFVLIQHLAKKSGTNRLERTLRELDKTLKGVIEKMSYYGELMEHGQGYEADQRERRDRELEEEAEMAREAEEESKAEAFTQAEYEEVQREEEEKNKSLGIRWEEEAEERRREEQAPRAPHNLRTDGNE